MVKCSRKPIALSQLWVTSHEKISDFYVSSWQRGDSPVPLLVMRLFLLVIALSILAWSVHEAPTPYWMLYLTNWGLVLVSAMTLSGFIVSVISLFKKTQDDTELPWYVCTYWFLFNITISIALVITALYWILLYDPVIYSEMIEELGQRMFWLDILSHGFNSLVAVAELLVCRTPVHLAHIFQPLAVGLWYAAFTAIYYAVGGTDPNGFPFIYEILDWRQGRRSAVMVTIAAAALIIIYLLVYGVAAARDKISTASIRTTSVELARVPPDIQNFPDINNYP